jgi:hypothetical protein
VRSEDRAAYIRALQQAQAGLGRESFNHLLYERLEATLEEYLRVLQEPQPAKPNEITKQL